MRLFRSCPAVLPMLFALLLTPALARAEVYGGIEIGAKGIKATVIRVTPEPDGYDVKIDLAKTANTTLVAGLAESGRFNPTALKDTVKEVETFFTQMRSEHKVAPERIYVVGSSGLFSALGKKEDLIAENKKALAGAVKAATGKEMNFIDVDREVELSIVGVVPPKFADGSLLLDVGSGNTKGGCRDGKRFVTVSIPLGTVTYSDLVKKAAEKTNTPFAKQADELRKEHLAAPLKEQVSKNPGLAKRERVYLTGGTAWALATLTKPADRRSFVALSAADIDRYRKELRDNPKALLNPDLSGIKDAREREEAMKDVEQVKKVFSPENLLAGAEVLKAMADEFGLAAKDKKLYFARHGYIGWILAYVAEQSAPK